ncbi:MAG: dienelactone hydrolase family protein [Mycobacterium sp.]
MASTRTLFKALTRRGPHRVLRGDLAFAGVTGVVYTPESGFNLPAVAFGHDWLTGTDKYRATLEHLASWGIVAAAPDTEKGLIPSHLNLAADLATTLEIVTRVRLGDGKISVHPTKLALVGHGLGGSAAVFAATRSPALVDKKNRPINAKVAVALFPSETQPPVENNVATLNIPGLVVTSTDDAHSLRSNSVALAQAWPAGELRTIAKAKSSGLPEQSWLRRFVGLGASNRTTQRNTRALLTGYLLFQLAGDKRYRDFADATAELPNTSLPDAAALEISGIDRVQSLLK